MLISCCNWTFTLKECLTKLPWRLCQLFIACLLSPWKYAGSPVHAMGSWVPETSPRIGRPTSLRLLPKNMKVFMGPFSVKTLWSTWILLSSSKSGLYWWIYYKRTSPILNCGFFTLLSCSKVHCSSARTALVKTPVAVKMLRVLRFIRFL